MQVTKEMIEAAAESIWNDNQDLGSERPFGAASHVNKAFAYSQARNAINAALSAMWQPIETAPRDGTWFQARIPGHGDNNVIAWMDGLMDSDEEDCGAWFFPTEQEPPDCWTDGVCWDVNEDGVPSVKPTHWMPLPPAPETK